MGKDLECLILSEVTQSHGLRIIILKEVKQSQKEQKLAFFIGRV